MFLKSRTLLVLLLHCVVQIWSRGVNVVPLPRTTPTVQVTYPLRPGSTCNPPSNNPQQLSQNAINACGSSQPGPVKDILYAGEPYQFAFLRGNPGGGGTLGYFIIYDGFNESFANFNQRPLATGVSIDGTPDGQYLYAGVNVPPTQTCSRCVVAAVQTDTVFNVRYYTCADVMIVHKNLAWSVTVNTRAPNPDYEPMFAENVMRAALVSLDLTETRGVHIMRWPVKVDDVLAGIRYLSFEIRFNEVPGLYPNGLTTLYEFGNYTDYIANVLASNGFLQIAFTAPVAAAAANDLPPEIFNCNRPVNQQRQLSPTEGNTIAAAVLLSFVMVAFVVGVYLLRPRLHKMIAGSSKGFTFTQLAGGVTLVNAAVLVLFIVALIAGVWAQDDEEYMTLFEKCQTAVGNNYGNNGAYCVDLFDLQNGFLTEDGETISGKKSLEAVRAFVILGLVPMAMMFAWSLSSLFTRSFLRYGLQLAYAGLVAMASSFLAVCVFGAWYNDVWAKYAQFHNEGETVSLAWGYWMMIALIPASFVAYAASLSLAAKEGDNTTQASVTRNWGDAPFASKAGMAGANGGGGGGGSAPATAPRPSMPDRPNPNRGGGNAPPVAPRPAAGWFNKAPAKPKLAPGWQEVKSSSGDTYFWNATTNESTWEAPLASASAPVASAPPPRPPAPAARGPTRQGSGNNLTGGPALTRQGSGRSNRPPPSAGAVEI